MRPTTSTILFFFPESLTGSKPGSHSQCSLLPLVPSTSELRQSPPWSEKMRGESERKKKKSCLIIWRLSVTDAVILYCTSVWVNGWEPTTISVKGNLWKMDILPQMNSGSLTGNLSIALNSLFEVKSDSLLVLMHLRSWERCKICKQSEVLTDYPTVH